MRLTVVGGSGASTPELIDALAAWPGGPNRRPGLEVVLQGRSAEKLALVADACRRRLPPATEGIRILSETDLDRALDGADVILVQVRVGGLDARRFDETFPRSFAIPGEETQGPGGFANAMRTIPTLAATWDRIVARAPHALVINLTNPSGIVTAAMIHHSGLKVVSVCDAPVTFVESIAKATGQTVADVRAGYAGMNHAGFWAAPDRGSLLAATSVTSGVDPEDVAGLGALPTAYLRFYLHPDRQLVAQLASKESRAQVLKRLEAQMLGQYAGGVEPSAQSRRGALWYRVSVVPLLDAVLHGSDETFILGLPNAGDVPWAPPGSIVEIPTRVGAGGTFHRDQAAGLPAPAADLLARHAIYEALAAEALAGATDPRALAPRRNALVRALAANPMVPTAAIAGQLVDAILAGSPA
jgi:6-phospho-beta-glucosidase